MSIVTLSLAKAHMNIAGTADDELLQHYIEAAEASIANAIGMPLATITPFPATLKQAALQLASHFYENREATLIGISAAELPFGVADLIRPHRTDWFGNGE